MRAIRVAEVDDFEPVEDLESQIQVIGARLVGGGANGARAEASARPVRGPDVERCPDDRHVGSPRLQLFDLGEEGPVPERCHAGVSQLELLDHPRRKFALMFVIVTVAHPSTVPPGRLNRTRYGLDAQPK